MASLKPSDHHTASAETNKEIDQPVETQLAELRLQPFEHDG